MNLKNRIKSIEKTVQMQKGEARTVRVEFVDVDVPEFTDEEIADCERLKLKYDEEYKNELARVEQLAAAGKRIKNDVEWLRMIPEQVLHEQLRERSKVAVNSVVLFLQIPDVV